MSVEHVNFDLAGRLCAVTGGGSGIGRAICIALANEGARVAILDRDMHGAEETLSQIEAAGGSGIARQCDVADADSVESAHAAIAVAAGHPEILVNNAGRLQRGGLADLTSRDWTELLGVNLTGYFHCAQIFGRSMLAAGHGTIVNIGSISAKQVIPSAGAYSISKAAVTMLSAQLAVEWGPRGVRSNVVHPGFVRTPLSQSAYDQPGIEEGRAALVPLKRIGKPDDITGAVLFLASPLSGYVNGAELMVDGGLGLNLMSQLPKTQG